MYQEVENIGSSINVKPNKPDTYDGRRSYLTVSRWLNTVEQYLNLWEIGNDVIVLEGSRKTFAPLYMKRDDAVWWFHLINNDTA